MKRTILLFIVLLISCTPDTPSKEIPKNVQSNEKVQVIAKTAVPAKFSDEAGPWTLGFSAPETRKDSLYPLIVYLHGGVGTSRTDKGMDAFRMFSFLNEKTSVFLASPSANRHAPWWSPIALQRIYTAVEYMLKRFPIDHRRIYLAGVSDGATALFAVAAQASHPFAGFIGAAGYPLMFQNQLKPEHISNSPIHMYISGKDRLYPADKVEEYYKDLQSSNVPITYTVYKDAEHGFEYRKNETGNILDLMDKWHQ